MADGLNIFVGGLSFKTADIALREKLSLSSEGCRDLISRLKSRGAVEAAVLSTCNRFELVLADRTAAKEPEICHEEVSRILSGEFNLNEREFRQQVYVLQGRPAIAHLFRVACGLESMVIGEPQILGQLKEAYDTAKLCSGAGVSLHRLFHRAFHVAKLVRTNTAVGRHVISFGSVARDIAEQVFGDLAELSVLLVGGGEMGRLLLRQFQSAGVRKFFIANRTLERACQYAEDVQGVALPLERIAEVLHSADIIIGAALRDQNSSAFVDGELAHASLRARNGKPQLYVDLGVPRNFDPAIQNLADAFLYNVDDFEEIVQRNIHLRQEEVEKAETLIEYEVSHFLQWLQMYPFGKLFRRLREAGAFRDPFIGKSMKQMRRNGSASDLQEGSTEFHLRLLEYVDECGTLDDGEIKELTREFRKLLARG